MVDNAFSIFNTSARIVDNSINEVNILNRHVECYPQKSQYGSCVIFHSCHARTPSVCDFSGFSKRIPSLEHPRVVCTLPPELRKLYRRVSVRSGHGGKRCSLSSSYFTHIDRLTSARNCVLLRAHNWLVDSMSVLQSLEVWFYQQMIRHSSFQGAQRYEY